MARLDIGSELEGFVRQKTSCVFKTMLRFAFGQAVVHIAEDRLNSDLRSDIENIKCLV